MTLTDTHCHIHSDFYKLDRDDVIKDGRKAEVRQVLCVGTTLEDSERAINFVSNRENLWATIGIHPHEAKLYKGNASAEDRFTHLATQPKVVAVGECGLDYYYNHSPKADQQELLRFQIELALKEDLPMIFHVREAFDDFWKIFDEYKGIRGVVHSFTANRIELEHVLQRGLYLGLNGIMTFTKKDEQLEAAKLIPLTKMLLETDAPFLTPAPYRGTICQLKHLRVTAEFLAKLRGETLREIADSTTLSANTLFKLT